MTKLEELGVRLSCAIDTMNATVDSLEDEYVKRAWDYLVVAEQNYYAALMEEKK